MKKFFVFLFVLLFFAGSANALSIIDNYYDNDTYKVVDRSRSGFDVFDEESGGWTATDYTGTYIGTLVGGNNDNLSMSLWNEIFSDFLGIEYTVTDWQKIDAYDGTNDFLSLTYNFDDDGEAYSGTWETTGLLSGVTMYSVKGAKEFAIYYVDPAQQTGDWTTAHLLTPKGNNQPDISHFSADIVPTAPIPEPGTVLLLSMGLLGAAGVARKKFKK